MTHVLPWLSVHSFIHSSICKAPLQETYREAPRATAKQISLEQLTERIFVILRQKTDLQGEPNPGGMGSCCLLHSEPGTALYCMSSAEFNSKISLRSNAETLFCSIFPTPLLN